MFIVLLVVSVTSFVIIQLPPGDWVTSYIRDLEMHGNVSSRAQAAAMRKQYGLDLPVYFQYFKWMGNMLQGDFGDSYTYNTPVSELIAERLPFTIMLSLFTLVFTYVLAIPIGIYSATHQYSAADYSFTAVGFIGLATPNFLLALIKRAIYSLQNVVNLLTQF